MSGGKTFQKIAEECVHRFRSVRNPFGLVDDVAAEIATYRVNGAPLSEDQHAKLLELIRAEFNRTGGIPAYIRDGSNAGSVDLVALLSAKLKK